MIGKHTEIYNGKTCELCEIEVINERELKQHLKIHSYKEPTFNCEDCDYWGPNELSLKLQYGRCHTENLECGLCYFIAMIQNI